MACLFHKWDGCICTKCGKIRDKKHKWREFQCERCGSILSIAETDLYTDDCPHCDGTGRGTILDGSGNVIGCETCSGSGKGATRVYSVKKDYYIEYPNGRKRQITNMEYREVYLSVNETG